MVSFKIRIVSVSISNTFKRERVATGEYQITKEVLAPLMVTLQTGLEREHVVTKGMEYLLVKGLVVFLETGGLKFPPEKP